MFSMSGAAASLAPLSMLEVIALTDARECNSQMARDELLVGGTVDEFDGSMFKMRHDC